MIPAKLFELLVRYFVMDETEHHQGIKEQIEMKSKKLYEHQLYTIYKKEKDSDTGESAKQEYLDSKGISKSFRW